MLHKKLKPFPKDFLWGASTSAYQVEGANLSHGKGPSVQDVKKVPEGTSDLTVCADFYHRYKEDLERMLSSFLNRLEPSMIAGLSLLVGFVLISIMLPLMNVLQTLG